MDLFNDPFLNKFVNFATLTLFLLYCLFSFTSFMMEARQPVVDTSYEPELHRIKSAVPEDTIGHSEYITCTMTPHNPRNYLHAN